MSESLEQTITALAGGTDPVITLSDGRLVTIYRCRTRHLAPVLRLIQLGLTSLGVTRLGDAPRIDLQNPEVLLTVLADIGEVVWETAAHLCDQEEAVLQDLLLDDMLSVLGTIVEVNKDFFEQRVLAAAQRFVSPELLATLQARRDAIQAAQASPATSAASSPTAG